MYDAQWTKMDTTIPTEQTFHCHILLPSPAPFCNCFLCFWASCEIPSM